MGFAKKKKPVPTGDYLVRAIAAGYHMGPRSEGDEFLVPSYDGKPPESSWFVLKDAPPGEDLV